jgi:hypothetical protein
MRWATLAEIKVPRVSFLIIAFLNRAISKNKCGMWICSTGGLKRSLKEEKSFLWRKFAVPINHHLELP